MFNVCQEIRACGTFLPNRFSGLLIMKPSWPPAALTDASTCGTSARSERSSHQRTLRTALLSCWSAGTKISGVDFFFCLRISGVVVISPALVLFSSYTAGTQQRSQISPGTPTSRGSSALYRRTTSCKCGRW